MIELSNPCLPGFEKEINAPVSLSEHLSFKTNHHYGVIRISIYNIPAYRDHFYRLRYNRIVRQ